MYICLRTSRRLQINLEALEQAGALGPDLLGAHGIHLTDPEIKPLAKHDVRILHNPLSNMRLASGIIRLAPAETGRRPGGTRAGWRNQ